MTSIADTDLDLSFIDGAVRAVEDAGKQARRSRKRRTGTEDVLIALAAQRSGYAARLLLRLDARLPALREAASLASGLEPTVARLSSGRSFDLPGRSAEAEAALSVALEESRRLWHFYVGTGHLLLGIVADEASAGSTALGYIGLSPNRVRDEVLRALRDLPEVPDPSEERQKQGLADWEALGAQYSPLSPYEERRLAMAVEKGISARENVEAKDDLLPNRREELELLTAAGEEAFCRLLNASIRLLPALLREYPRNGRVALEVETQALHGLHEACARFDWRSEERLDSYVISRMRRRIADSLCID